jgi:hypothetical protein
VIKSNNPHLAGGEQKAKKPRDTVKKNIKNHQAKDAKGRKSHKSQIGKQEKLPHKNAACITGSSSR